MIGRVGHFEDAVNGVYVRVRGEAKKDEVRLFYEKTDGVVLCYGTAAWKDSEAENGAEEGDAEKKKPIKGWMIGWYQDVRSCDVPEGGEAKRLFIAARCQMGATLARRTSSGRYGTRRGTSSKTRRLNLFCCRTSRRRRTRRAPAVSRCGSPTRSPS